MSRSQKQAVITLMEKKGKDRLLLENWRPISLVNVDAKIMSKVIATRIKNVLPNIIQHNQTGYVKDRYIGETVRSVFDVIDLTLKENVPGLLIFIDCQKAFDSLEWNFLLSCLEAFNFGPDFIRWVKTFYKNIQSCVINNGLMSDYFTLERGVRQGGPLSPYLFVWNNKEIRVNNKPVFYKNVFVSGIIHVNDLLFHLNSTDSFNIISKKISRTNVLIWAGLWHSVPSHLKTTNRTSSTTPLSFRIDNKDFDALKRNRKITTYWLKAERHSFQIIHDFWNMILT